VGGARERGAEGEQGSGGGTLREKGRRERQEEDRKSKNRRKGGASCLHARLLQIRLEPLLVQAPARLPSAGAWHRPTTRLAAGCLLGRAEEQECEGRAQACVWDPAPERALGVLRRLAPRRRPLPRCRSRRQGAHRRCAAWRKRAVEVGEAHALALQRSIGFVEERRRRAGVGIHRCLTPSADQREDLALNRGVR